MAPAIHGRSSCTRCSSGWRTPVQSWRISRRSSQGALGELARAFPEHAEWIQRVLARVVDLHAPFKAFDVYHPLQNGRTSIKAVLPALTGSGYEGMAIADGGTASQAFMRIAFGRGAEDEVVAEVLKVRGDLEAYCRLDTLAMVRILDALERLAVPLTSA